MNDCTSHTSVTAPSYLCYIQQFRVGPRNHLTYVLYGPTHIILLKKVQLTVDHTSASSQMETIPNSEVVVLLLLASTILLLAFS